MSDVIENDSKTPKSKNKRMVTLRISREVLIIIIAAVLILAAYFVGVKNGKDSINKSRRENSSDLAKRDSSASSNRWTAVGNVQEISDTNIKVKDSRDEVKDAKITKDTTIVDRKGTKLAAKDLKKDQRVIVSGTKDDKGALTATRIRLQQ